MLVYISQYRYIGPALWAILLKKIDMCPLNRGLYLRTIGTMKTVHYTEEEEKYGGVRYSGVA